jgi:hypothetical protein
MIARVFLWSNGTVTARDRGGQHLPDYEGRLDIILEKVLADAPPGTRFFVGDWHNGTVETTRDCFACWRAVVRPPGEGGGPGAPPAAG